MKQSKNEKRIVLTLAESLALRSAMEVRDVAAARVAEIESDMQAVVREAVKRSRNSYEAFDWRVADKTFRELTGDPKPKPPPAPTKPKRKE